MKYALLQQQANDRHLTILGAFHPQPEDQVPGNCETLLMLGPDEPAFWSAIKASPEWQDEAGDPIDRWSARVIGGWADEIDAQALFPFGGPPYQPFFSWALRTGRVHTSPIMLLVHDRAGLFVSFRGALALSEHISLPPLPPKPCTACVDRPCLSACPVNALDGKTYEVSACKALLDTDAGATCMSAGCMARRACPVSQAYPRLPAQSAYHMKMFKG